MGNTCLYGATGGFLFAAGRAGERFAVRNSRAIAVVEGVGDHGCEYMTGGTVVVLGSTGRNFGAGMSGGLAFVYDEADIFESYYNADMVDIERLDSPGEIDSLRKIIEVHHHFTESPKAKDVLKSWDTVLGKFWRVVPHPSSPQAPTQVFEFDPAKKALTV